MLKDEVDKEHISYTIKIMMDKYSVISPKFTSCYISSLIPYEETLAMADKAITNNKDIHHSSAYSPNNIYVTGYNKTRSISGAFGDSDE